jgi:hypothetical protein
MTPVIEFIKNNKLALFIGLFSLSVYTYYQTKGWVCFSCATEERFNPATGNNRHK